MDKEAQEKIARMQFERGVRYLADFYDGLENIPAELLDRQWDFELAHAEYALSELDYRKLPKDRSELRKDIARLRHDNLGCGTHRCPHWQKDCYNYDWVIYNGLCPEMLDQILTLFEQ